MLDLGKIEICRFLPPPLLEGFDPETLDVNEFLDYVAKARVVEELETLIVARAISDVLSSD